jgi:hypothetical protein
LNGQAELVTLQYDKDGPLRGCPLDVLYDQL